MGIRHPLPLGNGAVRIASGGVYRIGCEMVFIAHQGFLLSLVVIFTYEGVLVLKVDAVTTGGHIEV